MKFPRKKIAVAVESLGSTGTREAGSRVLLSSLGACALIAASTGASAQSAAQPGPAQMLETVEVVDFRGTQVNSPRYTRDLIDTPRIITVLPDDLLQEQGATSLKDALKNIPGISLQAGEGNPPSGDQFKIRGFNARDDINVNGVRDPGNYFRDPFFVDQLEIIKGPNSAFSGRGSVGGTVNFVTKKPFQEDFNRMELSVGTDSFFRSTIDMNKKLDDNNAIRINLLGHSADMAGRDTAEEKRYGIHAAYTWGFKGATRITADLLHMRADDLPDAGLPSDRNNALGTLSGIDTGMAPGARRNSFYGYINDRKEVSVDQFGLAFQHAFAGGTAIRNQLRLSRVHNDGWVSSPRISTAANPGGLNPDGLSCSIADPCVRGETKPRDQVDIGINNQTDLLLNFKTGGVEHDLVLGMELARFSYENDRLRDSRGPWTRLGAPKSLALPAHQVIGGTLFGLPVHDGTTYKLVTKETGLYALDTMKLSEKWELHAGLRWDSVEATATRRGFNGANGPVTNNTTHTRKDNEISYNLGLVYKLTPTTSVYGAFGSAYVISANFDRNNVQLAGGGATEAIVGAGFNSPPEKAQAYEIGAKWRAAQALDMGVALFRTDVTNGRIPAQAGGTTALVDNKYLIEGFELLAAGDLTRRWKLYAGYTHLSSKITAAPAAGANEAYVTSQKLGNTPQHSFNFFTTYDITPAITVGGGMQHVGGVTSGVDNIQGDATYKVRIPGYTTYDLYAAYKFSRKTQLRLNLYNVADKEYIAQLADGGAQGIPGPGRRAVLTLRHDF